MRPWSRRDSEIGSRYKTLIFDLDGTISDPTVGIARSVNFALGSLGYETVTEERVRPLIGPSLAILFRTLTREDSEEAILNLVEKFRERYGSVGYSENELYDEIPEVLNKLSSAGHLMGVCTGKRVDFAIRIIEMFGLSGLFEFVSGGDVNIDKKMQLATLISDGLDPGSSVLIGDRAVDVYAARTHGIASTGVLWGFGDHEEISESGPNHTVNEPGELLDLFRAAPEK